LFNNKTHCGYPCCYLKEKGGLIHELHSCKRSAGLNNYQVKLVKAQREFIWNPHNNTDEFFMVIDGSMQNALRDRKLELQEGELVVIPRGVDPKPLCIEPFTVLLIEPKGTPETRQHMRSFDRYRDIADLEKQ
jgi:mannose-6-phosphate isomerase-like protein (cupin superfamily)